MWFRQENLVPPWWLTGSILLLLWLGTVVLVLVEEAIVTGCCSRLVIVALGGCGIVDLLYTSALKSLNPLTGTPILIGRGLV
jgi:hypothetical protein